MHNQQAALATVRGQSADPLLAPADAASYLDVKEHTLAIWRTTGRYNLPYIKIGRKIRYRQSELDAFLERRTVGAVHAA